MSHEEISELNVRTRYDTYGGVARAVLGNARRRQISRQRLKNAMGSMDRERLARILRVGGDGLTFQSGDALV